MGNYIVSARKYRPKGFDEVVGQDHITTTLTNAIKQDQLAQALLFCGPRGVGKTTCARIVANMINGFDQQNDQGSSTAMNIYELDAASNNSVDDIRNLIDQVRYPPQYGRYKVYIIDEVHMLSNQAFNAFLKTLEEPPSYAIFILATTEKHKVIPTILSRCQIFDFNRIQISDITARLENIAKKEKIQAEHEALHLLAQKADGALRDALSLFDLIVTYSSGNKISYKDTAKNLHILDYDYYFEITDGLLIENLSGALMIFNDILKKGFDGQNFIVGLAEHFRNLLISQDSETIDLLEVSENVKSRYLEQSRNASKSFLLSALNISNQCDIYYKGSKNQRLHVEIALMKMAHLKSALKLKDINFNISGQKKKRPDNRVIVKKEITPELKQEPVEDKQEPVKKSTAGQPVNDLQASNLSKKTVQIPDIEELKNKAGNNSTVIEEDLISENKKIDDRKSAFSEDQLKIQWENYASQLKRDGKDNECNLMAQHYELKDNNLIIIHINNSLEQDILLRFKTDLLMFLKNQLNNDLIKIDTELKEKDESDKIYTNTDKFNHLAKKNPNLIKLKSKFGLDTEF
jgi:DNA polymerase-3 subunit gamma/tau